MARRDAFGRRRPAMIGIDRDRWCSVYRGQTGSKGNWLGKRAEALTIPAASTRAEFPAPFHRVSDPQIPLTRLKIRPTHYPASLAEAMKFHFSLSAAGGCPTTLPKGDTITLLPHWNAPT
jgi:hypothetical protein